jgi:hypothetical protein
MKKLVLVLCVFVFCSALWAQQATQAEQAAKYALVIGNGNYTALGKLKNPANDADDIAAALKDLGFTVDKVLDGDLEKMENAVMKLKTRLSAAKNAYGFLFYAGHGVQSNGVNYLIPVGANIPSENYLRNRALAVQTVLDELNDAGNELNVVVLDACRDNPFSWGRTGNRGLTVVGSQPADSIVVYATSAGQVAQDGTGRNGLFTSHLLNNLRTPGLEVSEIFRRTGNDVSAASDRKQVPAVYSQFFGTAYFDENYMNVADRPAQMPYPAYAKAKKPIPAIGYSFMNLAAGLGSYLQGDYLGGAIVTGGYAAAIGLIAWELSMSYGDAGTSIPGNIGVGVGIAAAAFGIVKPLIFGNRKAAAESPSPAINAFDFSLVPDKRNRNAGAFAIRYTHSF